MATTPTFYKLPEKACTNQNMKYSVNLPDWNSSKKPTEETLECQYLNDSGSWKRDYLSTIAKPLGAGTNNRAWELYSRNIRTGKVRFRYRVNASDEWSDWCESPQLELYETFTQTIGPVVIPSEVWGRKPLTVSWNAPEISKSSIFKNYDLSYRTTTSAGTFSLTNVSNINTTEKQVTIPEDGYDTLQLRVRLVDIYDVAAFDLYSNVATVRWAPDVPRLTVPELGMEGQEITVNWTASEFATGYVLERKASTDPDFVQVYSGQVLTYSETIGPWSSVQYRVKATGEEMDSDWTTSLAIPVTSANALVISGQDGDLGTLVNDVPYTVSTDTGNQITVRTTVNAAPIFEGNVASGTAESIPVLDLVNGDGTIIIEASVETTGSTVSAARRWTYHKDKMTFPNSGSPAELTKAGETIWPKTLAECVRIPGGRTLEEVMGFPAQIFTGSYEGTGTYGQDNPVEITFPFVPDIWWIFGETDTDGQYTAQDNSIPVPWGKTNLMLNAELTASYSGSTVSFYRSTYPSYNEQGKVYSFLGIKIG